MIWDFFYKRNELESYDAYLKIARDALSLEDANQIFQEFYDSLDFSEEIFRELYKELVSNAIRYAAIRAMWSGLDREEKIKNDDSRTNAHNKLVNAVENLSGYQKRNGQNYYWFEVLGQGVEPEEANTKRKRIGDWGCFIALFVSLNQR